ncbi:TPA: hypothetical protein ACH6KS_001212 [Enterococcus faecium]|jgi:hypothetical protein|uniref:hypothetical protein n=1 Tax=Enterococcus faecium TaxID=1352 RepID=UPI0015724661|nr:hypothetical protein [Enterococcus faecium]MBD9760421.1 hypothetical protein [Enterococcus faecium]MBD9782553.1 hypothetical protein [Enterococcus faecium]MDU1752855.1 hypothetical protein [Enterococcus faecium]NTJ97824.1 hypothetical protein [Enterococcus faecium]NTL52064.1 hypothetical protein [Enterococcus faecium]
MLPGIFYDHNGEIIWSGVSALISLIAAIMVLIGVIMNVCTQRKIAKQQIDANLKAKARIDWITKVRDETADFVTNCLLYIEYSPTIEIGKPKINSVIPTSDGAIIDVGSDPDLHEPSKYENIIEDKEKENIRVQLNNSGNRLILYFGPDKKGENKEIVQVLEIIIKKVNEGTFYKNDTKSKEIITEFRNKIRTYLKKEWDKAKQGK